MKNKVYTCTVFYFAKPYSARVLTFMCYGKDRKVVIERAKQFAQDFADENEIEGARVQLHLNRENISGLQEVLDCVITSDFKDVIIKKPRIFDKHDKIPLQIGDKTFNI
jgi:hypothetical protein